MCGLLYDIHVYDQMGAWRRLQMVKMLQAMTYMLIEFQQTFITVYRLNIDGCKTRPDPFS